jgi:hypothetical protein
VGRYVSEAWFGRRLAQHPPAYRRRPDRSSRPLPAYPAQPAPSQPAPSQPEPSQPEPSRPVRPARPELTRPAGILLLITGAVLLLAVSIRLPFLNLKLLGLILVIAGLVKVRALQRASGWLWRNRRDVMTALDAPHEEAAMPRVPLDVLLAASPPATRRAGRRSKRRAKRQVTGPGRRLRPGRWLGRLRRRRGQPGQGTGQPGQRPVRAGQLADAGDRR